MERLHMNYLRDIIYRLQAQESARQIARDLHLSRSTVGKYRQWADEQGFLDADRPLVCHHPVTNTNHHATFWPAIRRRGCPTSPFPVTQFCIAKRTPVDAVCR